jgi:hypothetical protein
MTLFLILLFIEWVTSQFASVVILEGGATYDILSGHFYTAADYSTTGFQGIDITPGWFYMNQTYGKCPSFATCCTTDEDCSVINQEIVSNDGIATGRCVLPEGIVNNCGQPGRCEVVGWCPTVKEFLLGPQKPTFLWHEGVKTIIFGATLFGHFERWSLREIFNDSLPEQDTVVLAKVSKNKKTSFETTYAVGSLNDDGNSKVLLLSPNERRLWFLLPGKIRNYFLIN